MARTSPPTGRVIEVLEFLAAHPTRRHSLADLVKHLDITKATCHVVLGTLAESGYVVRDPVLRTYGLGPALITLGAAAQVSVPALDIAAA